MDFQGIYDHLKAVGAPGLLEADLPREKDPEDKKDPGRAGQPFVLVDKDHIVDFLATCREEERLSFEILADQTATDPAVDDENLWVNYELLSVKHKHRLAVKVHLPKADPKIATAVPVYRAAQWAEREAGEMYGITFVGHPDPRNILLPDDWEGSPLRKDYEFPKEYHGISCE